MPAPASGERTHERITMLAPSRPTEELKTDVPSARPTSVPDVDDAAMAALRWRAMASVPPSIAVPVKKVGAPTAGIDLRVAFVLLHVDGVSTIADIANLAQLPIPDAIACFVELLALGIVELTGMSEVQMVPTSAIYPRR